MPGSAVYKILYHRTVKKELRRLAQRDRSAIFHKIESLSLEPKPKGHEKLRGSVNLFRIRHGDHRIIYQIQEKVVIVVIIKIGHRKDVYRNL